MRRLDELLGVDSKDLLECALTASDILDLAFGFALVLDTDGAAMSWWVGCHLEVVITICKVEICQSGKKL